MPDVFSKTKRSQVMSRIRGRGNESTEVALARLLRANGITGWRRHRPVFGRPDFVFPKPRVAVFVDGCFWHACPKHSCVPVGNREFWVRKLEANKRRDAIVNQTLRRRGWLVIRVWEHEISRAVQGRLLRRIKRSLGRTTP